MYRFEFLANGYAGKPIRHHTGVETEGVNEISLR